MVLSILLFGAKFTASETVVKFPLPSAATVRISLGSYSVFCRIRRVPMDSHGGKPRSLRLVPPLGDPGLDSMDSELLTCS